MPQMLNEEIYRSIWSRGDWAQDQDYAGGTQAVIDDRSKIVKVRDYKDKFILRMLQQEARKETPGFRWFDERSQNAEISWSDREGMLEPSGYMLITPEFYDRRNGSDGFHWYPDTLNQLFVRKEFRRNGIATGMISRFANDRSGPIWVESPKWETRAILDKIGYKETHERYEIWQMREGLTKWRRS